VPVVPFPAWSAAAKKIPKRIPKFDPSATQPGEACVSSREAEDVKDENGAEAAEEVEAEEAPKKRRRKNGAANNGAASSSMAKIPLPTYILDLLYVAAVPPACRHFHRPSIHTPINEQLLS
jgi:hypothetical protein